MERTERQKWSDKTRYVIINEHGSVQLEIFDHPRKTTSGSGLRIQALIYSLWVDETHRRKGIAKSLMDRAESIVKEKGIEKVYLEWSLEESPYYVIDWYIKRGYDEKEFGNHNALLEKIL